MYIQKITINYKLCPNSNQNIKNAIIIIFSFNTALQNNLVYEKTRSKIIIKKKKNCV